jgi:hypothetical protein
MDAASSSACSPACGAGQECCRSCSGGGGTCVAPGSCGPCLDAGSFRDAGTDAGETDAGEADDAGAADAGGSDGGAADGSVPDGGNTGACDPGTCRLSPDGACQTPSGPTGNGCCECTGDEGTSFCRGLSGDTPIATPTGDVPVSELEVGDLVYSVHEAQLVPVMVARAERTPVSDHRVVRVRLETGVVLEVSPRHPTADGRDFGGLAAGDLLDGAEVLDAEVVSYEEPFTYDILPDSETGTYVAGGVLIGSTLSP